MNRIKKFTAILLAMLIFLTGCQVLSDTTWAFELEGERMPAGAYILFMNQATMQAFGILQQQWLEWEPAFEGDLLPTHVEDMTSREILNSDVQGVNFSDWVIAEAQVLARRHFAVQAKMAELGISLDPDEIAHAAARAQNEYHDGFRQIGVAESSLAFLHESSAAITKLFFEMYRAGGAYEISPQEMRDYFGENYVRGHQLIIWLPADAPHDEQIKLARSLYERMRAGEAIEDLQYDLSVELRGEGTLHPPGSLDLLARKDDPNFDPTVLTGLASISVGQSAMFEEEHAIILVRRLDVFENPGDMDMMRDEIIFSMRHDDHFLPMLDQLGNELPIRVNQAAIRRYGPASLLAD